MDTRSNITFRNNASTGNWSYTIYYKNLEHYYLSWYLPLTLFVGLIGGFVCAVFLIISKIFPKNVLIWMLSICVGDLMILVFDAMRMLLKVWFRLDVRDINDATCKMHNFLSNYFIYWSGYMQACMSIQRLICMMKPLQARGLFTNKLISLIWLGVTIFVIFPTLPYLIFWELSDDVHSQKQDCAPVNENLYGMITVLDIIVWGCIPLFAMTTSTIGISCVVFKSTSETSVLSSQSQTLVGNAPRQRPQRNNDKAWHVTRLLMSMNILYFVSNFPLLIYQIYLNAGGNKVNKSMPQQLHKTIYYALRSICYLSCSWNWVFYCISGNKFRGRAFETIQRFNCFHRPRQRVEVHTKLINISL